MTDQPTNPLVAGKTGAGRKATIDDLYACAAQLNASAAESNCPYSFAVVPNDDGKMCVRKIDSHHASRGRLCTPDQADAAIREFGLRANPLDVTRAA